MIKKLAIFMICGITSTIWASEALTVQVINAVYEKSVTKEFDTRLKKSGLAVHKKIENGRYVVTIGDFKDEKSARNALKKVRTVVTKDAFLRPVNRHDTAVAQTKTHPKTHTAAVEHSVSTAPIAVAPAKVQPVVAHLAVEEHTAPVVTPAAVVATVVSAPAEQVAKPSAPAALSECDKKEMRKDAFAEAIKYYKTSPYHRFEPVVLRQ